MIFYFIGCQDELYKRVSIITKIPVDMMIAEFCFF